MFSSGYIYFSLNAHGVISKPPLSQPVRKELWSKKCNVDNRWTNKSSLEEMFDVSSSTRLSLELIHTHHSWPGPDQNMKDLSVGWIPQFMRLI